METDEYVSGVCEGLPNSEDGENGDDGNGEEDAQDPSE